MLTIGRLAAYAGVTVRTVRHYHQVGLLPEPARDRSGYRTYGADDVVRLIKIRTLAGAGVPLSRVPDLLDAPPERVAEAVHEIDARMQDEMTRIQLNRDEIAKLAKGDDLALPDEVAAFLGRLCDLGVSESMLELEREAWIIIAARWPERIPEWMAAKQIEFDDPVMLELYRLLDDPGNWSLDDPRLVRAAELLAQLAERTEGQPQPEELDDPAFAELLDSLASRFAPVTDRIQQLMNERGWSGWTQLERTV